MTLKIPSNGISPQAPELSTKEHLEGALLGLAVGSTIGSALEQGRILLQNISPNTEVPQPPLPSQTSLPVLEWLKAVIESQQNKQRLDQDLACELLLQHYPSKSDPQGVQTQAVLDALRSGAHPDHAAAKVWERSGHQAAGSGGMKRALPIAFLRLSEIQKLESETRMLCQLTHLDPRSIDSALAINRLLVGIINSKWKNKNHTARYLIGLTPSLIQALHSAPLLPLQGLTTSGFSLTTLQASYHSLIHSKDYATALHQLFSLRQKSSTLGMLAGSLLGAKWGSSAIPSAWRNVIPNQEEWLQIAQRLTESNA